MTPPPPVQRIAIFGPGLLGGSLALAARERLPGVEVRLWGRRAAALAQAAERGIAHVVDGDPAVVADGADLIVLATPVGAMAEVLGRALETAGGGGSGGEPAVVTDVGSVKRAVLDALVPVAERAGVAFVGSHPMAGSENAGLDHARGDLFAGAACIVTPDATTAPQALQKVRAFWVALGAKVFEMGADAHDAVVARVSHVPHVAASAVVSMALADDTGLARFAGGGFRDTTRVAAGDADLWTGILMENRRALAAPLADLIDRLQSAADALARGDAESVRHFLDRARKLRHSCPPSAPASQG